MIDAELKEIQENQRTLKRSSPEAIDEVTSLKARYPDIIVARNAGADEIYHALYKVRKDRATILLPLASEKGRIARLAACQTAKKIQILRQDFERGEEYKRMTLSERLDWRKDMDAIKSEPVCAEERDN